jgi:hypothetical protein
VNGDFRKVLENIRKINEFKSAYKSPHPKLYWQFVVFGHNEHEIVKARKLSEDLNMTFRPKLSWEDLYTDAFSTIKNSPLIRIETGLGVANRDEYRKKYGKEYVIDCCYSLWGNPQVHYDGRVLGCSVNYWDDYGNALKDGLSQCVNGEKMEYARGMLSGRRESADGIPCSRCKLYKYMRDSSRWITEEEIAGKYSRIHSCDWFETNAFGYKVKKRWTRISGAVKRRISGGAAPAGGTSAKEENRPASRVYPLRIPLPADEGKGWTPHHIFKGPTEGLQELSCHASVLIRDHCPHDPHLHKEEELLLLLSGEVDLILQEGSSPGGIHRRRRLRAGQFAYYPSNFAHTLQTTSDEPANYLMFKWHGRSRKSRSELACGFFDTAGDSGDPAGAGGFRTRLVFEGPTAYLQKLHCHISFLAPGGAYAPHVDRYDVAILLLQGEVETLGETAGPHDVIFYAAGEPHGMRNPAESPARYIVFEFHGH